jgi:protein-disulfide isomerase
MRTTVWSLLLMGILAAMAPAQPEAASYPPIATPTESALTQKWKELLSHAIGEPAGNRGRYTAVEFGDFECPSCAKTRAAIDKLVSESGDATRLSTSPGARSRDIGLYFVSRPFPTFHKNSIDAAAAAMVAAHQHQFWPMRKALYAHYDQLTPTGYAALADSAGLDGASIQADVTSGKYAADVIASEKLCDQLEVVETPTLAVRDNDTGHISIARGAIEVDQFVDRFNKARGVVPPAVTTAKQKARTTHTYSLGVVHGIRTFCRVSTIFPTPDDEGVETVSVTFFCRSHGRSISKSMPDLVGFPDETRIQTADFTHLGHKQVLVSVTMGHVETHIFDFDGRNVKPIYELEEGRVGVRMIRIRDRGWRLQESWGRLAYEDDFDLGTGYDRGNDGIVRYLHWNGKRFVPDRPGPTCIYDRNGHKERGPVQEYPRGQKG